MRVEVDITNAHMLILSASLITLLLETIVITKEAAHPVFNLSESHESGSRHH